MGIVIVVDAFVPFAVVVAFAVLLPFCWFSSLHLLLDLPLLLPLNRQLLTLSFTWLLSPSLFRRALPELAYLALIAFTCLDHNQLMYNTWIKISWRIWAFVVYCQFGGNHYKFYALM